MAEWICCMRCNVGAAFASAASEAAPSQPFRSPSSVARCLSSWEDKRDALVPNSSADWTSALGRDPST
jgi:hypothetical protein